MRIYDIVKEKSEQEYWAMPGIKNVRDAHWTVVKDDPDAKKTYNLIITKGQVTQIPNEFWQFTEDELFTQTRKIHEIAHVYRSRPEDQDHM